MIRIREVRPCHVARCQDSEGSRGAGVLAAARLLELDTEAATHALGLACHRAGGSAQSMREGVLSRRLGPGFAARSAVLAAFLAADGISGTRHTLDGSAGLFPLYERNEVKVDVLNEALGTAGARPSSASSRIPAAACSRRAQPGPEHTR